MKKTYVEPDLKVIDYDFADIITVSLAVSEGDNEISSPTNWWD